MVRVVNKHTHVPTPQDVYIGRGSPLGNPYSHKHGTKALKVVGSREKAVALYKPWLLYQVEIRNKEILQQLTLIYKLHSQGLVNLVCFCSPQLCHGEIIKEIVETTPIRELYGNSGHRT